MSENSLKIRQKFISKLSSKIEMLNEDLELLRNVDRKILRKSTLQRGGAGEAVDLKELQIEALKKKLMIERQNKELKNALDQARDLTTKVDEIRNALTSIKSDIESINIEIPDATGIKVPNVDSHNNPIMGALAKYELKFAKGNVDDKITGSNTTVGEYRTALTGIIQSVFAEANVDVDKILNVLNNNSIDKIQNDEEVKKNGVYEGMKVSTWEDLFKNNKPEDLKDGAAPTENKYRFW